MIRRPVVADRRTVFRMAEGVERTCMQSPHTSGHIEFVHRRWPADPEQLVLIRRELHTWLAPLALTGEEIADVVLAVDEAAANAVRHAYDEDESGAVELTLWTEAATTSAPATLCIEIVDHGSWQPPVEAPATGGRGIELMNVMSESVLIHFDDRGSRVLLRHRIPEEKAAGPGYPDPVDPDPVDADPADVESTGELRVS